MGALSDIGSLAGSLLSGSAKEQAKADAEARKLAEHQAMIEARQTYLNDMTAKLNKVKEKFSDIEKSKNYLLYVIIAVFSVSGLLIFYKLFKKER